MKRFDKENDYNRVNTDYHTDDLNAPFAGYLFKKSSSGDWQRRYFEINGNYLIYYKNDSMAKLLAAVSIPQLGDIRLVGEENDSKGKGYVIQLDLKDKQYFLRADSYEDAEKWITHLLFVRDGELALRELRSALNNSPTQAKSVSFVDISIPTYNPQHNHSQIRNSPKGFGSVSCDDTDEETRNTKKSVARFPPVKRSSDANWQKAHRSLLSCCFRNI